MKSRRHGWKIAAMIVACVVLSPVVVWAQEASDPAQQLLQKMLGADEAQTTGTEAQTEPVAEEPLSLSEAEVAVSDAGTVTLNVVDLPLSTVLRVLSLETNRNIIATPSVTGTVTASLHNVSFEEALDAILIANGAAYRADGKFIYVYTRDELATIMAAEHPPESRVFRLNYITSADLEPAITPLLSDIGNASLSAPPDAGVASDPDNAGGMALASPEYIVVYDRPENLTAIAKIIRELDVRPQQVLIEATILSADLEEDNELGVDFALVGGVDLQLLGATSTAVQDVTLGQLPQARLENFNASAVTGFTSNVGDGGIRVGIVKDNVAVFVQALEQITDTVVIANPKVLALNKQKGQVLVGRRDGYLTTTVTETQAIQTVEYLETGTNLVFRPFIGDDGFIRMEIHPQDSIGGLTAANLPFEQTAEVTTNVIIKDGQTILIGGLFREAETDSRSQIPGLGDIPALGTLFQSRADQIQRQEVIVLLTVHVVKDHDAYAKQSEEEYQDIERLRVGMREGMMGHGRERRAQSLYQTALEHYAAGDLDSARWFVRMSLHNNPRSLAAIKLQEELRGERNWEEDGTVTRGFIERAIMRSEGLGDEPILGRPAPPFVAPAEPGPMVPVMEDGDAH